MKVPSLPCVGIHNSAQRPSRTPLTRPDRGRPARLAGEPPSPTLYRTGGVPGLALRGSPPQTPPTETLPDLGLVRGRREAPQRRHNDLADQRPRRRRPVPVEARGTAVPASTPAIAGQRARRAAPRRLRLPRPHPQLD